jgi:hypothetical protein
MGYLGLTPASPQKDILARLIEGMEPDKTIDSTSVPIVLIYDKTGRFGRNYLVYEGKFCLDVYHKTSYQAKQATARAFKLFHDKPIDDADFHSPRCMMAFDDYFATGITGVKGREIIFDVDFHRMN